MLKRKRGNTPLRKPITRSISPLKWSARRALQTGPLILNRVFPLILSETNNPGTRRLDLEMVMLTKSPSRKFFPHLLVTNHLMIVLSVNYQLLTVKWVPTRILLMELVVTQWMVYTRHLTLSNFNLLSGNIAEISQYLPKTPLCQWLMATIKNSPLMWMFVMGTLNPQTLLLLT